MLRRNKERYTARKQNSDAGSVIQELREKMSRLKFRLLDCQNQNQMLRKELLQAKKVVNTEVLPLKGESFKDVLNQGTTANYRGRKEKIMLLKGKLNELQNRIKQLEDAGAEKSADDSIDAPRKDDQQKCKIFRSKQMINKELQYLLEHSCQLKRKLEVWKKRSTEQSKEVELLRLELKNLAEKSQEDSHVHQSYHSVEKELRSRQKEKLDIRSKLDIEKTRNEQLVGEITTLKENISLILSSINDGKVLIEALKNQQGNLHDLLERQKLISENDNRRFNNDLREIQAKHATNDNTLRQLHEVVEEKNALCLELQDYVKEKEQKADVESSEKSESTVTSLTNDSEQSQPSEPQQQPSPASDASNELNGERAATDPEETSLAEECEQHKNILRSMEEEVYQLRNVVLTNDKRLYDWMIQLMQSKSLLSQKNAEVRDLEQILKLLQKSSEKKRSPSPQPGLTVAEEIQKRSDILTEEFQCLLGVWELLLFNEENSVVIYMMSIDTAKWFFVDDVYNLTRPEDDTKNAEEQQPVQAEDGEKSENT